MEQFEVFLHPVIIFEILKQISRPSENKKIEKKIGCVLGFIFDNKINCSSSFEIPFDKKSSNILFLDKIFMEKMALMFKKINNKEKIIGWYNLKNKITQSDIILHKIFFGYAHYPILFLFWIKNQIKGVFFEAFIEKQKNIKKRIIFQNIPIKLGMLKCEEIGIYQILYNSIHLHYIKKDNIIKKWIRTISFFSKFMKKMLQGKNFKKKIFFDILYQTNSNFEANIIIFYLSNIFKLFFSMENIFFRK
jgi:hypothetical protein